MRLGQIVMLIGTDGYMPPMGAIGEVVEVFDGEDYGVDFARHPCPVGPEPYWYVPPEYLMPLNDGRIEQDQIADAAICASQ